MTTTIITAERAVEIQAKRKVRRGGRPKKLKSYVHCGQRFGVRALREHLPKCLVRKRPLKENRPWNF